MNLLELLTTILFTLFCVPVLGVLAGLWIGYMGWTRS